MNRRPLLALAALAAATSPDLARDALDRFKTSLRERVARDPMSANLAIVLGAAWLFYRAEKGHNPKVNSYYDALVYVATNMSVGYADIFAHTSTGKALGAAIMTYGPAVSGTILDAPADPDAKREASSNDVVERLDKILGALEALRAKA